MQSGVKDGKVTLIMSYEEWQDLYSTINNNQLVEPMLSEVEHIQQILNETIIKELSKIPNYMRRAIELRAIGHSNIASIKKEEVVL